MNINIPVDSRQWLFEPRSNSQACLWSLGRWRPKCEIGDELLFRFDGKIVARARVWLILHPGEHNTVCHNGARELKGWKVVWKQSTFRDLRNNRTRLDRIEQKLRHRRKVASRKPSPPPPALRACRECGCTDDDCRQCIERTGRPCHWVEVDLCSACVDVPVVAGFVEGK